MSVIIGHNHYGKVNVKLMKIFRYSNHHEVKDLIIDILLEGDFDKSYSDGDNTKVLPTDTMKNTVYALAAGHRLNSIEEFGIDLAEYLLENNPQVSKTNIDISENNWEGISIPDVSGKEKKLHRYSFINSGKVKRKTKITSGRDSLEVRSGLEELSILKTADSSFEAYIKDKFTTLRETKDRLMGTKLNASWLYNDHKIDFVKTGSGIQNELLKVFSEHKSLSVQHTLHAMGSAALERCDKISEITLTMPNVHNIPVNLELFGLENRNEIFVPTIEPYGFIEATLKRK